MSDPRDMTGAWTGTFTYPSGLGPVTPFVATIADDGGALTGATMEIDAIHGGTVHATPIGRRGGDMVDLTKTYAGGTPDAYDAPIDYVGRLSADGLTVTGSWSLAAFDGTFEMTRDAVPDAQTERAARTVDA